MIGPASVGLTLIGLELGSRLAAKTGERAEMPGRLALIGRRRLRDGRAVAEHDLAGLAWPAPVLSEVL